MPKAAVLSSAVETAAKWPAGELAERRLQPGPRRAGVGHRLDGGEGLRGDDDQRALRVEPGQRVVDMRAVDVRDVVRAAARRDRAPAPASPSPARGREPPMPMLTTSVNLPPSVAAIAPERTPSAKAAMRSRTPSTSGITSRAVDEDRLARAVAQRDVQHRPVLGRVDRRAGEHRVAPLGHAARLGELDQERQRPGVDRGLGEVEQHVAEPHREARRSARGRARRARGSGVSRAALPASASACQIASVIALTPSAGWPRARAARPRPSCPSFEQLRLRHPRAADAEHVRQREVVGRVRRRRRRRSGRSSSAAAARRRPSAPARRRSPRPGRTSPTS